MKNVITKLFSLAAVMMISLFSVAFAQNITGKSVKITVGGTSTLHAWTMTSSSANFSGTVSGNSITNAKFSTTAKTLKSEKGKMMDNKAYDALKADKNPTISFSATSLAVGKGTTTGRLTIAGVTKNVSFPVTVTKKGEVYEISGVAKLRMSDFGMKPPTFMGAVKTGNDVTVSVNIVASK